MNVLYRNLFLVYNYFISSVTIKKYCKTINVLHDQETEHVLVIASLKLLIMEKSKIFAYHSDN